MVRVNPIAREDLEATLHAYEKRFETPSENLVEAFTNSPLNETDDFHDWSALYAASRALSSRDG